MARNNPIQPMNDPKAESSARGKAVGLTGLIGTVAAGILYVTIPEDEGTRYKAYRDVVGALTICQGDTSNVRPGMVETPAGCRARLERQLIAHAKPVMECAPSLKGAGRDYQRAAAVSLAYNVGTGAFCKSTVARRFNAQNWTGGCDALLMWNKAGGKVWRGLTLRRERERQVCLTNLLPGHTPENLSARIARYK